MTLPPAEKDPQRTPVMRTFKLAASSLAGLAPLAAKLGVSTEDVARWIAGIPPAPDTNIYLLALDIVSAGPQGERDTRLRARRRSVRRRTDLS